MVERLVEREAGAQQHRGRGGQNHGCGDDRRRVTAVVHLRVLGGRLRRVRWSRGDVGPLARDLLDQELLVTGQRGVGRLPAGVVGEQAGEPGVGVGQQAREHLVELEHADAARVAVALEPVAGHADRGPDAEQEPAQIDVLHRVVVELHGPFGLEQLKVGG